MAQGFAQPHPADAHLVTVERLVHQLPGFGHHAEAAVAQTRGHVFRGFADQGDLEIVDRAGPVHGQGADDAPAHEFDNPRTQAALDQVRAHPPDDGLAGPVGGQDSRHDRPEIVADQNMGQAVEKGAQPTLGLVHRGKVLHADLVPTLGQRIGRHPA